MDNLFILLKDTTQIDPLSRGIIIGFTALFFLLAVIFAILYWWSLKNHVSENLLNQSNWFKKFLLKNRNFFFVALAVIFFLSAISMLFIIIN